MTRRTILVCGLPRCGSSLTVRMLSAGGLPVTGRAPGYEPDQTNPAHFDAGWVLAQEGKVVKLLEPQLRPQSFFDAERFAAIFLTRDPDQQARSQIKFMEWQLGRPIHAMRKQRRAAIATNKRDTQRGIQRLWAAGVPLLVMSFERLVTLPDVSAVEIADFLARFTGPLNPHAMSRVVVQRKPDCLPFMLEDSQAIDELMRTGELAGMAIR